MPPQSSVEVADPDDADPVAVLLAEQRHGAALERGLQIHLGGGHHNVRLHLLVDQRLDALPLRILDAGRVREVEAQVVGRHQRAGLGNVGAQDLAQRRVKQVRAGMVEPQALTPARVHRHRDFLVLAQAPLRDRDPVDDELRAAIVGIEDLAAPVPADHGAGIPDLAAGLGIGWRPVEDDLHRLARPGFGAPAPAVHHGEDARGRGQVGIAEKARARQLRGQALIHGGRAVLAGRLEAAARPGAHALRLHLRLVGGEALRRHRPARVLEHLLGEVGGEPVGVVEREEELAVDGLLPLRLVARDIVENLLHAHVEGLGEALLLLAHRLHHARVLLADLRVSIAQELRHGAGHVPEEGLAQPQHAAVAHPSPHDAAKYVPAPFVGRGDAVGDEEGGGAGMIGNDPHGDVLLRIAARSVGLPGQPLHVGDERPQEVGLVVRVLPLQHCRDALEPHTGVDGRPRQRGKRPARITVVLHEDQVPDLEPAVALARGTQAASPRLLLRAGQMVALVEVHLGAWPAGPGVAHGPEIVLLSQAQDAVIRQPGHILPEPEGVVVLREHGRLEPVLGQPILPRQELPAKGNGLPLEVVAEREIPKHLEKGVMPRGPAHILEVVVLAARAHALLGGDRTHVVPALVAQEYRFELDHAGIGEQERGILGRHQRRGADHTVAVPREVVEEALANLGARLHGGIIPGGIRVRG